MYFYRAVPHLAATLVVMLQLRGHLERGCWTALAFLCLSLASSSSLSATPLYFAGPSDVITLGVSAKHKLSRLKLANKDEQKERCSEY
jgi:hypothetical protein